MDFFGTVFILPLEGIYKVSRDTQYNLGYSYHNGDGVDNILLGFYCYELAVKQGHAEAEAIVDKIN